MHTDTQYVLGHKTRMKTMHRALPSRIICIKLTLLTSLSLMPSKIDTEN